MAITDNFSAAFAEDNARNESAEIITSSFVPPDVFWQLFAPHHHMILGSRGSGKTFLSRMASYPFLSSSNHPAAQELVNRREYIGVFVNTDIRFVGSSKDSFLKKSGIDDIYFIWKFNLNCLKSISHTIDSFLENNFGNKTIRKLIEYDVVDFISKSFLQEENTVRLSEIDDIIADYEFQCRSDLNSSYLSGTLDKRFISGRLSTELFEPISAVIRVLKRSIKKHTGDLSSKFSLDNTKWLFFIDEAEYLAEKHVRLLFSFMRTNTEGIYLKIATLPFRHEHQDTNLETPIEMSHDYFVVSLDQNPIYDLNSENSQKLISFAKALYRKRVEHFFENNPSVAPQLAQRLMEFENVVGESPLDTHRKLPTNLRSATRYLEPHIDDKTLRRAKMLERNRGEYGNQIWRKLVGVVALLEDRKKATGRKTMTVYSGVDTCIRCTDGVPRRMINLFHALSLEAFRTATRSSRRLRGESGEPSMLTRKQQSRILQDYSKHRVLDSLSVPRVGPQLNELIERIGIYFQTELHAKRLSTDTISSIRIGRQPDPELWNLFREGIAYGYIFRSDHSPFASLDPRGEYRLAFALYPAFNLYPRKGKARALQTVLKRPRLQLPAGQLSLDLPKS